jgi:hypothetical protein
MTPLDTADIARMSTELDEHGYVVIRQAVSPDRLAGLHSALVAAYDAAPRFKGGGSYTGHLNCYPGRGARFVLDDLRAKGVVDLIGSVRPDVVDKPRATLNMNLPGSVAQHYHMDGLYTENFLVCNVAVVDTTIANGAIDVLPGTNRRYYKFWQYAVKREFKRTTRLEMQQGDALVRLSTLWHRGMPNTTKVPRPLMSITFGESSAPDGDPFEEHNGDIVFYANWYNTDRAGQLRERLYVKAPITYSAYRFVKSLHGDHGYSKY